MLAPDDLDAITGTLKSAFAEMRHADRLVTMGGSFRVYDIGEVATWMASLRTRLKLLTKDAMCLDGGSSTAMYYQGEIVMEPARALSTTLQVFLEE